MRKILITDDEKLTRAGICKIVRENIPNIEIVEAKNGQEALAILQNEKINILLTDIRMPVMTGTELMNNIKDMPNCPAIIVLSGFDEFSYAKEAIKCGAQGYILKPIDKAELITLIEKIIKEQERFEQHSEEQVFSSVKLEGRITKDTKLMTKMDLPFVCALTEIENKDELSKIIPSTQFFTIEENSTHFYSIFPDKYVDLIKSNWNQNEYSIISISTPEQTIANIRTTHRQAFITYLSSFFTKEKDNFIQYRESTHSPDSVHSLEQLHSISGVLGIASTEEIKKKIDTVFEFDSDDIFESAILLYVIYNEIHTNLISQHWQYTDKDSYLQSKSIMLENILTCKTLLEWKYLFSDYIIYMNELIKSESSQYPFITKAIEYVKNNFMNDINMSVVANEVDVNYTYFSETFKEQTGMNFNDYLKRLRIENAKVLIEKGCYKVYEISERCGFKDTKYFIKIFKEVTGYTPSEYKKIKG